MLGILAELFFFRDALRLQFGFESPNDFGVAILLVLPFLMLLPTAAAKPRPVRQRRLAGTLAGILLLGALYCLAATYSRGAWAAFAAEVLIMTSVRGLHRVGAGVAGAFCCLVLVIPHGRQRIESMGVINEDRSIGNRLALWKNTTVMLHDFWAGGVGRAQFADLYDDWYRDPALTPRYLTAVSDPLTIGAYHGLPVLVAAYGTAFIGIGAAWCGWHMARSRMALAAAVSQVGFLLAGLFSTFVYKPPLLGLFLIVMIVGAIAAARGLAHEGRLAIALRSLAPLAGGGAAVLTGAVFLLGAYYARSSAILPGAIVHIHSFPSLSVICVNPRSRTPLTPPRVGLVWLAETGTSRDWTAMLLRRLAETDVPVVRIVGTSSELAALVLQRPDLIVPLLQDRKNTQWVIGSSHEVGKLILGESNTLLADYVSCIAVEPRSFLSIEQRPSRPGFMSLVVHSRSHALGSSRLEARELEVEGWDALRREIAASL